VKEFARHLTPMQILQNPSKVGRHHNKCHLLKNTMSQTAILNFNRRRHLGCVRFDLALTLHAEMRKINKKILSHGSWNCHHMALKNSS